MATNTRRRLASPTTVKALPDLHVSPPTSEYHGGASDASARSSISTPPSTPSSWKGRMGSVGDVITLRNPSGRAIKEVSVKHTRQASLGVQRVMGAIRHDRRQSESFPAPSRDDSEKRESRWSTIKKRQSSFSIRGFISASTHDLTFWRTTPAAPPTPPLEPQILPYHQPLSTLAEDLSISATDLDAVSSTAPKTVPEWAKVETPSDTAIMNRKILRIDADEPLFASKSQVRQQTPSLQRRPRTSRSSAPRSIPSTPTKESPRQVSSTTPKPRVVSTASNDSAEPEEYFDFPPTDKAASISRTPSVATVQLAPQEEERAVQQEKPAETATIPIIPSEPPAPPPTCPLPATPRQASISHSRVASLSQLPEDAATPLPHLSHSRNNSSQIPTDGTAQWARFSHSRNNSSQLPADAQWPRLSHSRNNSSQLPEDAQWPRLSHSRNSSRSYSFPGPTHKAHGRHVSTSTTGSTNYSFRSGDSSPRLLEAAAVQVNHVPATLATLGPPRFPGHNRVSSRSSLNQTFTMPLRPHRRLTSEDLQQLFADDADPMAARASFAHSVGFWDADVVGPKGMPAPETARLDGPFEPTPW